MRVSLDGGVTWTGARTHGPNTENAWLRWTVDWTPAKAGPTTLLAQATDRTGHQQPDRVPFNRDGYLFDGIAKLPVAVAA